MQKLNLDPLTWQQHSTNVHQDGCSRGSAKEEQMNQRMFLQQIFLLKLVVPILFLAGSCLSLLAKRDWALKKIR